MSAGDYYLAVGNSAHDALNNILAAKDILRQMEWMLTGNADRPIPGTRNSSDGQLPIFRRKWNRSDESV